MIDIVDRMRTETYRVPKRARTADKYRIVFEMVGNWVVGFGRSAVNKC